MVLTEEWTHAVQPYGAAQIKSGACAPLGLSDYLVLPCGIGGPGGRGGPGGYGDLGGKDGPGRKGGCGGRRRRRRGGPHTKNGENPRIEFTSFAT